jgi:hypothetical protein
MPTRPKPRIHARDHGRGGTDRVLWAWETVDEDGDTTGRGTFSRIVWGAGFAVTDDGDGAITVELVPEEP